MVMKEMEKETMLRDTCGAKENELS